MRIGYAVGANQTVVVEVIIRSVVFVAVSYTHLDVYKRQIFILVFSECLIIRSCAKCAVFIRFQ